MAGRGVAGQGWLGWAWQGSAGRGTSRQGRLGVAERVSVWHGSLCRCAAGPGKAGNGPARKGSAGAGLSSPSVAWREMARQGRQGGAGTARTGGANQCSDRRCPARRCKAGRAPARPGVSRRIVARQGKAGNGGLGGRAMPSRQPQCADGSGSVCVATAGPLPPARSHVLGVRFPTHSGTVSVDGAASLMDLPAAGLGSSPALFHKNTEFFTHAGS